MRKSLFLRAVEGVFRLLAVLFRIPLEFAFLSRTRTPQEEEGRFFPTFYSP
jgi:hypothetical protein